MSLSWRFQQGQVYSFKMVEAVGSQGWILSYRGQLLRVENITGIEWSAGDMISLVVTSTQPLQFQTIKSSEPQRRLRNSLNRLA